MDQIKNLLVQECRRRLIDEGFSRIKKCLSELTEEEIWLKPNQNSNSVGNLVLHLCGNVRQWLVCGLGNKPDTRKRSLEFSEEGPIPSEVLIERMELVLKEVEETLDQLSPTSLTQMFNVQGFQESGLSIIVHVIEHFSYHVGQMTYFVKWRKDMDMGYYAGVKLEDV